MVILDVMMPDLDGSAILSALKSDALLAEVPVILVTIVDDKDLGYSLGAANYLTKPIDRARLSAVLGKFPQDRSRTGAPRNRGGALHRPRIAPDHGLIECPVSRSRSADGQNPPGRRQRDEPRHASRRLRAKATRSSPPATAARESRGLAQPVDLILMDLSLPVLDGWEATRLLKADSLTGPSPSSP